MNLDKSKKKYGLASAPVRIFCRLFDLILNLLIVVGLFFAIFYTTQTPVINFYTDVEPWRIFLFTLLIFILFFVYFVVLPFFTKGYTLFSKFFKIRIFSTSLQIENESKKFLSKFNFRFLKELLIRETFTFFIFTTITLVLGFVSFFDKQKVIEFLLSFLNSKLNNQPNSQNVVATAFGTFYAIATLIDILIIINICFTSRRRAFIDFISNTVVVKMIEVFDDDKSSVLNFKNKNKSTIKYNLPGEINTTAIFQEKKGDASEQHFK
ncbi:MAG: RDD family protein [Malacoplasma sp.]|nr:RDD family protein [Malacoplasma sp.]